MLLGYFDSILMGSLGQIAQTGWYNAATRVIYVATTPASIISMSFFPLISQRVWSTKAELQKAVNLQMAILLFLAIPIVTGGILLAPQIIEAIYGEQYKAAGEVLPILLIAGGLTFFCIGLGNLLIAHLRQGQIFWVNLCASTLNIVLNIILIPRYSFYGAASVALISQGVILLFYIYLCYRYTLVRLVNRNIIPILWIVPASSLVMGTVITKTPMASMPCIVLLAAACAVYLLSIWGIDRITGRLLRGMVEGL